MTVPSAPISLRPIFQHRIWGWTTLAPWYPDPATGGPIGEAWLTAQECVAENGPFANATLKDLTRRFPAALGGADSGEFPLLVKILFPREKLSVQVHPDDAQARAVGLPNGKTECWYVLSAEPGAQVSVGLREELSAQQIRQAIENGTLEEKLRYVPVTAGDMVYVDAGTVHALLPGIVVLETQQYSDATYRLYDYGRPRELHVDAGLAATRGTTQAGIVPPVAMQGFTRLIASPYFVVDRFSPQADTDAGLGGEAAMQLLVALGEGCSLRNAEGGALALTAGHAVVLPGGAGPWTLHAEREADVIRIAQP